MSSNFTSPVMIDGMDVRNLGTIPGAAEQHVVTRSTSSDASYQYWSQAIENAGLRHTTLQAGHDACTSGRNDVVMLSCDSHSQAATITWSKNMTHLIGMYGPAMMNQRSRIGHSATVDPLLDITGYGNTFANLYFMYGGDNATDLTATTITGNRNSFVRCHWNAPTNGTCADEATFKVLYILESEQYFNHCTIGTDATLMSDGELIKLGGSGTTPRLVFEDCNIIMRADANAPRFLDDAAGTGAGFIIFKNCVIHNFGTTLTLGFASTGLAAATDYLFVGDTAVGGASDVIAAADEAQVWKPANVGVTEDAYHGLMINPDHS